MSWSGSEILYLNLFAWISYGSLTFKCNVPNPQFSHVWYGCWIYLACSETLQKLPLLLDLCSFCSFLEYILSREREIVRCIVNQGESEKLKASQNMSIWVPASTRKNWERITACEVYYIIICYIARGDDFFRVTPENFPQLMKAYWGGLPAKIPACRYSVVRPADPPCFTVQCLLSSRFLALFLIEFGVLIFFLIFLLEHSMIQILVSRRGTIILHFGFGAGHGGGEDISSEAVPNGCGQRYRQCGRSGPVVTAWTASQMAGMLRPPTSGSRHSSPGPSWLSVSPRGAN